MRHRQLGTAALAVAVAAALSGCGGASRPRSQDAAGTSAPTVAGASTTAAPTPTAAGPTTAGPTAASSTAAPTPAGPAGPTAKGITYGSPVAVARAFTVAYYSYTWQQPGELNPAVRAEPYVTAGFLATLQPLAQAFPARMTAAEEVSVASIRSAAVPPDAPGTGGGAAFVSVEYSQHLTDHGKPADDQSAWSLQLVETGGEWRVNAIVDQD